MGGCVTVGGVVIVTGGGRGIGRATCLRAAAMGDDVVVNWARDADAAASTVDRCEQLGVRAIAVRADVSNEAEVAAMFDEAAGLGTPTVLVNNAGILHEQMRFAEMTVGRWRDVIEVNILGAFICAREAVRRMSTRHGGTGGAIVNVSSAAASLGSPGEYVDYAATKGAIDSLTVGLGRELAEEGVRVNAVRPGVILTDIHASGGEPDRPHRVAATVPMRRPGDPDEVAAAIMWLASDDASYITGATLDCTGGR